MLFSLRKIWVLCVSMIFLSLGLGFQNTIIPARANKIGFDDSTTSYIMIVFYIGIFLGLLFTKSLINRVGHIRVFAIFGTVSSTIIVLLGLTDNSNIWLAVRLLTGICYSGLYFITESWINIATANKYRGASLSIYMLSMYLGRMLGQWSVSFGDILSLEPFVWVSLVLSLSFIPVLLTKSQQPQTHHTTKPLSLRQTYQASPIGFYGFCVAGMGNVLSFSIASVCFISFGANAQQLSYFMLSGTLGFVLSLYPVGRLSDKVDRRWVMIGLSLISIVGLVLFSTQSKPSDVLYFAFALINFGVGPLYGVSLAQVNDWIPVEERLSAAQKLGYANSAASISCGIIASVLINILGGHTFYYMGLIVYGGLFIFAIRRLFVRDAQVKEKQTTFQLYPNKVAIAQIDVHETDTDIPDAPSSQQET